MLIYMTFLLPQPTAHSDSFTCFILPWISKVLKCARSCVLYIWGMFPARVECKMAVVYVGPEDTSMLWLTTDSALRRSFLVVRVSPSVEEHACQRFANSDSCRLLACPIRWGEKVCFIRPDSVNRTTPTVYPFRIASFIFILYIMAKQICLHQWDICLHQWDISKKKLLPSPLAVQRKKMYCHNSTASMLEHAGCLLSSLISPSQYEQDREKKGYFPGDPAHSHRK